MYSCLLREENRFAEYENVLDVKCCQNTTCVFGTDDYVKNEKLHEFMKINQTFFLFFKRVFNCLTFQRTKRLKYGKGMKMT